MSHREELPQLGDDLYLTDGGIETTLIFHEEIDLPLFAAFVLLADEEGTQALRAYFERYAQLARDHGTGFILESPTWRASPGWADQLDISADELAALNRKAIELMVEVRDRFQGEKPFVISGCIGPHGDGYDPEELLDAASAERYHAEQIGAFAGTEADMVAAITMTYADEAIGITRAGAAADMPVAIGFTVETEGKLPSGQPLGEAILQVDEETDSAPAYYLVNCAHPTHFENTLRAGGDDWLGRIRGVRANASTMSHAELDEAPELDAGDPADLGERYVALGRVLPNLTVLGGCCGTDHRHVDAIARAVTG